MKNRRYFSHGFSVPGPINKTPFILVEVGQVWGLKRHPEYHYEVVAKPDIGCAVIRDRNGRVRTIDCEDMRRRFKLLKGAS